MSTLITTSEAYPIFASRNWISQDSIDYGVFTATEMQALVSRVIDGDRFSYWQGSTFSDATTVVLTFSFNLRTSSVSRAFDMVILQNINWKSFIAEYSNDDGASYSTITGMDYTSVTNTAANLLVNIPAGLTANRVRFTVNTTLTANDAKKCGGVIICQSAIQLASGFLDYKVKNRESFREMELGDKTLSREYILRSGASYDFYGASFDCPYATAAELALLRTIKREGYPFILCLEPGVYPEETYLVHFDGPWGYQYENPVRSIGYAIPMKVKEVGTHT